MRELLLLCYRIPRVTTSIYIFRPRLRCHSPGTKDTSPIASDLTSTLVVEVNEESGSVDALGATTLSNIVPIE